MKNNLINKIFNLSSDIDFNELAVEIFHFQYKNNSIYKKFVDYNKFKINNISHYNEIPFLPIDFFKSQKIFCLKKIPELVFESSGTTGMTKSRHFVKFPKIYEYSFLQSFRHFYNEINSYCIIALLPNYSQQKNSSLIYMMKYLIKESNHPDSGFYQYNYKEVVEKINQLQNKGQKIILWGVSFALLFLAENYHLNIPDAIVFETGGMKGQRKEITREELHSILTSSFGVKSIHSEYGMTELLSQAYSKNNGIFFTPPWMKIIIRETNDPLTIAGYNKTGGINVIDLANLYSCSFIATQDLGKIHKNNSFEVLGRFDNSDVRGCNLLTL